MKNLSTNLAFLLVFVILVSSSTSAYTYLNIYLDESGNAEFLGQSDENISLPMGITHVDGQIRGFTNSLTSKNEDIWKFSYSLQGADIKVILPKDTVIKNFSSGEILLQQNKLTLYSKNGNIIYFTIEKQDSSFSFWIIIAVIVLLGLIIYFYIIKFNKSKKSKGNSQRKINKLNIIKDILNNREKLILDTLSSMGKTKMSFLRKKTEIPKASFSRHIQELEKKKLIKKSGEGKNKFIEIIKK